MTRTQNLPSRPQGREVPILGGEHVYLAAPKSEYDTLRYRRLSTIARSLFPTTEIVEARTAFLDLADWRASWHQVLASVSALVFLTTSDGWIGRGVWTEIRE